MDCRVPVALAVLLALVPMLMACSAAASAADIDQRFSVEDMTGLTSMSAATLTLSHARADSAHATRLLLESKTSGACSKCGKPPDNILFMYEVHGWLMSIAWGVLAPAAIVLAYNFRNVPPSNMWFHAHRAIMLVAYLMQLAGVGVVIAVMPQYWEVYSRQVMIHIAVGIALEILAGGQVLAAMVKRPSQASRYRRAWNVAHTWTGRLLLLLGIALIFDGLLLYHSGQPYQHLFIALSAILFFFFSVAAGKDAYDQVGLPPPAVAMAAAAKLPELGKLPEAALQPPRRGSIEFAATLDSARVSPSGSSVKLADV
ncbi:probable cytochrome b561 and DOMON domain-containing protein At3g25 [Coccomyxa sp. Obi]|nr:probable cytochrome b561 and DOMON domain-containing protein At3g25 [Coccomyxa sp. Obi]